MTNVLSLDLRRAEWQEIADFIMAMRPVTFYNAVSVRMDVRVGFRDRLARLVEQAQLEDYIAIEAPAEGFMLSERRDEAAEARTTELAAK